MKKYLALFLVLAFACPLAASAQETINWIVNYGGGGPIAGGFSMIPGQTRTYFVQQKNNASPGANFSITSGGGSLSNVHNGYVDYTAPSSGSTCGLNSTQTTSATMVVLSAVPKDAGAAAVSLNIAICNPPVAVNNIPSFRMGVYKSQPIELQSFVYGTVNKNVTWSITTNPGGAGSISDTGNGDTVFTATAAGRYVVTSTSVADGTKTGTSIIDVTANALPIYNVTPDGTEPVDCSQDTNLTGNYYQVGPGKTYADFTALTNAVTLGPGDQVSYANQDTTGLAPTTIHNYVYIPTVATQTQPLFIVGCPDSTGHLPILDGTNATGNYFNIYLAGLGLIMVRNPTFSYWPFNQFPSFIQISGLRVQNANATQSYYETGNGNTTLTPWGVNPNPTNTSITATGTTTLGSAVITGVSSTVGMANSNAIRGPNIDPAAAISGTPTSNTITMILPATASGTTTFTVWNGTNNGAFVAGIRLQNGTDLSLIGNNIQNIGNGIYTEATNQQSAMSYNILSEGNRIFNCAYTSPNDYTGGTHCFYLQSFNEVSQFNNVGPVNPGAVGGIYKERGLAFVTRYNYFHDNDAASRNADMVDEQDAPYTNIAQFWGSGNEPNDPNMTANILMANWEMFEDTAYFYGNTQVSNGAHGPVHYWGDHEGYSADREGPLNYFNNTLVQTSAGGYTAFFDNTQVTGGTPAMVTYEWPLVNALNSIAWVYNNTTATTVTDDRPNRIIAEKLIMPDIFTNDQVNGGSGSGWPGSQPSNCCYYSDGNNTQTVVSGFGANLAPIPNVVALASTPFNTTTFVTTSITGDTLPASLATHPVRFQFHPQSGFYTARATPVTGSAGGLVGSVDSMGPPPTLVSIAITGPSTVVITSTSNMTATGTYSDSSTANITASCSWTSSVPSHATVGVSTGIVAGIALGTTNIACSNSGVTAPNVVMTVIPIPPNNQLQGPLQMQGKIQVQ